MYSICVFRLDLFERVLPHSAQITGSVFFLDLARVRTGPTDDSTFVGGSRAPGYLLGPAMAFEVCHDGKVAVKVGNWDGTGMSSGNKTGTDVPAWGSGANTRLRNQTQK